MSHPTTMRFAWDAEVLRCSQVLVSAGAVAAASRRTWRRALAGLVLGIGGLILVIAGMPGVTGPALPVRKIETVARVGGDPAEPAVLVTPVRLEWTRTWPAERSHAVATSRDVRLRLREGRSRFEHDRAWDLCLLLIEIARNQPAPWTQQCPGPLNPLQKELR